MPTSIKIHLAITVLFALLTVSGLLLILLDILDINTLTAGVSGEWTVVQLTFIAFICFVTYTVFTFNVLMFYLTGRQTGYSDKKSGIEEDSPIQ